MIVAHATRLSHLEDRLRTLEGNITKQGDRLEDLARFDVKLLGSVEQIERMCTELSMKLEPIYEDHIRQSLIRKWGEKVVMLLLAAVVGGLVKVVTDLNELRHTVRNQGRPQRVTAISAKR